MLAAMATDQGSPSTSLLPQPRILIGSNYTLLQPPAFPYTLPGFQSSQTRAADPVDSGPDPGPDSGRDPGPDPADPADPGPDPGDPADPGPDPGDPGAREELLSSTDMMVRSDPQLSSDRHHGNGHRRHKKKKHHRKRKHREARESSGVSPAKAVKLEPGEAASCSRVLPDPRTVSYPVQALVDMPINSSLTRSSRTSSLSSSLSSFRFGGSLSQLALASQMSLAGKQSNMKSTGNLNADTATMPSLGNQYYAFGGSLPELSLTSLSRLLPNSVSSSEGTPSSGAGLYTLVHHPLYVYPSQQALTTPFINANGSITFGSFLSGGSSLCNTQKSGSSSSQDSGPSDGSIITSTENKVSESAYIPRGNGVKLPVFPPGSLVGQGQVLTTLPGFHTLSDNCYPLSSAADSAPVLNTLATSPASPPLVVHSSPPENIDSKKGIIPASGGFISRPGVIHSPLSSLKLEREPCIAPSPVKLSQASPDAVPVISVPMSDCLAGSMALPHHSQLQSELLDSSMKREKERPYKCDHPGCDRSFSFPAHLRSHIQQIHISYRPCKCDFPGCGKRFYTPQHLNVHRRVHTGERPFVCPYSECGKAFTTAGNLKNHIRTHTGERPYSCKFDGCTKCFAEMSSLKKHELTHTGEKPYKCRVCGKAFSQAGSRNTHERKHSRPEDEGAGESSRGQRRFRIKRITSTSDTLIKTEPLL